MMLMRTMIVMVIVMMMMMMMTTMTTGCSRHIGQRWAAATVVGLEAEVPSYPLVATNLPSGHSFCHRLIIIIVIVIIVNIVNIVAVFVVFFILSSKFQTTLEDILI